MENNSNEYIVYCTVNKNNNKIYIGVHQTENSEIFDFYIGCGVYINNKYSYEKSKTRFQCAVKKHGVKAFTRKTLAVFNNAEDAYALEAEIVNDNFLKRNDVYNMHLGGYGGDWGSNKYVYKYNLDGTYLDEFRSISDAAKNVNRANVSITRAIKTKIKCADFFWSFEKLESIKLDLYKVEDVDRGIAVYQYDNLGNYECCYQSLTEASRILNIDKSNINNSVKLGYCCKNKYFSNEFELNYSIAKTKQISTQTVYQYGLDGTFIAMYNTQKEAQKSLNIKSSIYNAIKLGRTCGDFQWRFEKFDSISKVLPKNGKSRPIGKFDKLNNLICTYSTVSECKKENGAGMTHVLQGRDEFHKNFRYKYLD